MAGKGKTYTVYRITAPDGMQYVGYTSMAMNERWRKHRERAFRGESIGHPFYDAIRSFGSSGFIVEKLAWTNERMEALQWEQEYIASIPAGKSMNLSSGGLNDASEGSRIFWERLNADPEKRAAYLKKLSDVKKANDWTDYEYLSECSAKWRKEHPKEAYKLSYRALRISNKKRGYPPPSYQPVDDRPLKVRLMHKYKLNEIKRQNAAKAWSDYSDEQRAEICRKISDAQKASHAKKTSDEIATSCANARSYIDKDRQGDAASRGIKRWWKELKADPVRYKEYMNKRTESLLRTLERKAVGE